MSTQVIYVTMLCCDGCDRTLGEDGRFHSAMETRLAAYAEGWRFPPKVKKDGSLSAGGNTSDVCPDCLPGWQNQPIGPRSNNSYRPASKGLS